MSINVSFVFLSDLLANFVRFFICVTFVIFGPSLSALSSFQFLSRFRRFACFCFWLTFRSKFCILFV